MHSQPVMRLTGQRVVVTEMTIEDVPQYHEWFWEGNPQTMSCRKIERSPLETVLEQMRESFGKEDTFFFAVRRRDDNRFIGRFVLFNRNESNRTIEIGYMIGSPFRRKGYAREAMALLLDHAFDSMKVNKVHAQTGDFNVESIRLLEHFGFKRDARLRQHHLLDGVLHDDLVYSLLSAEYRLS